MKKIVFLMLLGCSLVLSVPATYGTVTEPTTTSASDAKSAELKRLTLRLEEINAMDKSQLTRIEKRALRKEVKQIKEQMRVVEGGVYISAGVLILIVILLIILL